VNFSLRTKIKDIYSHPLGHDILHKVFLQSGISEGFLKFWAIKNLSLGTIRFFARRFIGDDFFHALIDLLNTAPESQSISPDNSRVWWKEAVFYQIYPRSFKDSDGDGIGDLRGITSKLDYLQNLGIDAIWLCPIYDSPGADNGYDIRDYFKISEEFGGMEALDELLEALHHREMKLIMDLVVNHTSDEHIWFQHALRNKKSPYRDYYFFSQKPANNWMSFFSGSAWKYHDKADIWSLHLFSDKQMDLNWAYEPTRQDIYKMIRWWLKKGIDGFRLDVINYISKTPGLPNGSEFVGHLMGYRGIEHYFHGPNLHKYLAEMRKEAFDPFHAFSIGETPGIGREVAKLMTAKDRGELDMIFCFDILETPGHARFQEYIYDPVYLKTYFTDWMTNYANECQMAIFYNNHDNPRMLSKLDPIGTYRVPLSKLLAVIQLTLRGTPFIYQGDELGAINQPFKSIDELRDVESLNLYKDLIKTHTPNQALAKVLTGSRDHARVPIQWETKSTSKMWITGYADDFDVETQIENAESILNFYKALIKLRKANKSLIYGDITFDPSNRKVKPLFSYYRKLEDEQWFITCNLSTADLTAKQITAPPGYKLILSNYKDELANTLRPYEAQIYSL
jgi:oligo-1,6-glucosidase